MPYEMRVLILNWDNFVSLAIQNHAILESPDHFFEHPNQRDNQAELCQLKKFCLSSE
jgi:hypothetical protein